MSVFTLKIASFVLMPLLNINHKPIWGLTIIPFTIEIVLIQRTYILEVCQGKYNNSIIIQRMK